MMAVSAGSFPLTNKHVSSANKNIWDSILFTISLQYISHNRGPSLDPCGTPAVTYSNLLFMPSTTVHCCLFSKYDSNKLRPRPSTFACCNQALTSTRGYSLPDFLYYYPYPTRKFLLPDRVEGSQEHSLNSIFDISKESKCNTFVMMDIFTISRNENFALQQCQSRFIFKFIIKLIYKKPSQAFVIFSWAH